MSEIEAELVKLLKFKKHPEDYEDRQEYLTALAEAVDGVKDDTVFDKMTEPTYDWLQDAVEARNKKQEIEDFPDAEPEVVEDAIEAEEAEAVDEETDPEMDEKAPEETTEEPEESEGGIEIPKEPSEEVPQSDTDTEGGEQETEPAPTKKHRNPRKGSGGKYLRKKKGKPDIQPKHKPGHEPDYTKITGKKDRYGVTEGTKTSMALKMLEKGCTMRDVQLELGDTQYNMLRKLHKRGHRIDKLENKVLKLIHKDDVGKKGKGK